ncbi:MAG: hypothetical protein WA691_00745 [Thermoplasmata archaeon]
MSEYSGAPEEHAHHVSSPISVVWVVVASLLSGVGLLLIWMWLTTFSWTFSFGPLLVFVGVLMFLSDRAGLDRA